jgi:hypothetical protein
VSGGAYVGATVTVLRSADGTGLFVMPASGALTAGEYHLGFTYERDITAQHQNSQVLRQAGSAEPELVGIDVPWRRRRSGQTAATRHSPRDTIGVTVSRAAGASGGSVSR